MTSSFSRKRAGRIFKIALLGDGGVGKTALKERFLGKGFQSSYMMTVGADFAIYSTEINGEQVKLQIWDLAGQDRFKEVRTAYYQGALGALMVYDVTRKDSAENLVHWKEELLKHGNENPAMILVGNKIDLRDKDPTALNNKAGKRVAESLGNVNYVETSAKEDLNVPKAFMDLANTIYSSITGIQLEEAIPEKEDVKQPSTKKLTKKKPKRKKKVKKKAKT